MKHSHEYYAFYLNTTGQYTVLQVYHKMMFWQTLLFAIQEWYSQVYSIPNNNVCSLWSESGTDLLLRLTHTDSNFDQSIGDSLVVSELHKFWCHWDTKLLGHFRDFILVWLCWEGGTDSLETLLSIHKSHKLTLRIIARVRLCSSILLSFLLVSCLDISVHLSLHKGEFLSCLFWGVDVIILQLYKLFWITHSDVFTILVVNKTGGHFFTVLIDEVTGMLILISKFISWGGGGSKEGGQNAIVKFHFLYNSIKNI